LASKASAEFRSSIKRPHDLEYEKTFWPFILLSKKRYVGNKYEHDISKCKQASMGIVLKRRDNAPIVKTVYGGLIDVILDKQDIQGAFGFLRTQLKRMEDNKVSLEELVITKSLRSEYKDPTRIAHKVLAERMGQRDPGNKPQVNDRIPFVYIVPKGKSKKVLQGERIEHVDYVSKNKLKTDVAFYITNQVMNPVCQLLGIVVDQLEGSKGVAHFKTVHKDLLAKHNGDTEKATDKLAGAREAEVRRLLFDPVIQRLESKREGLQEITHFFKPKSTTLVC
jgi:DNA polymerase elongation subunit (family B)